MRKSELKKEEDAGLTNAKKLEKEHMPSFEELEEEDSEFRKDAKKAAKFLKKQKM